MLYFWYSFFALFPFLNQNFQNSKFVARLLKAIGLSFPLLFAFAFKIEKKETALAIAIVGRAITIQRAIQERSHESMFKADKKKWSKEVKSDNFCKVGRAMTKWGAIE